MLRAPDDEGELLAEFFFSYCRMREAYEELLAKYQVAMEKTIGEVSRRRAESFLRLYEELEKLSKSHLGASWCKYEKRIKEGEEDG